MSEEELYIGIDLGTTHIKSAVFREDGIQVQIVKASTPIAADQYGQIYDPILMFDIVRDQIVLLLEQYPKIAGISVTGMAEAGLIINRLTRKEETVILPWFDKRTAELSDMANEEQEINNFYSTGLRNSFKYGIYKFLWLLQHNKINKETAIWLSACDYIIWRLTGEFMTDPSFAARTYVYDIVRKVWDSERLSGYGLTCDNFPKVLPSGARAGKLIEPYLLQRAQDKSIFVCIGGHDHICAAYAVLNEDKERICNSVGTAETYLGMVKTFAPNDKLYQSGLVYGPFMNGSDYFWMGNITASGQTVEWFRKKLQQTEISYEEMNEKLTGRAEDPTDIIFLPFLSGIGTPYFLPEVSGAFHGLRAAHDRWDMFKAILEGLNYQGCWVLSLIPDEATMKLKEIICVGGAAVSEPWMQIKANILGLPVKIPRIPEATLLGAVAIMLQRNYGEGKKQKFLEIYQQYSKEYHVNRKVYEEYQEIYRNKYMFLVEWMIKQELSKKE
jgi:xylulokinase